MDSSKVVSTHRTWNTHLKKTFTNRLFEGIPFIVGYGGLVGVCSKGVL